MGRRWSSHQRSLRVLEGKARFSENHAASEIATALASLSCRPRRDTYRPQPETQWAEIEGIVKAIPESARAVLESAALAHLVTLEPDGSPQVTLVWVGLDGDEIVAGHLGEHRKVKNIRNDGRVAISFETGTLNAGGLPEYLVVYGTARISEGGAADVLQRLAHTYMGPDVVYPPAGDHRPGYVTHIAVDRITGVGPWATGD
jgi:PPOX class probable F420-dependent enzyme